ncbi:gamma-glutamyltransferase [Batrachochytrium salamandrivorans]|nr:gamma-glutamyltransferase [Batrachochytrium salamandrivorans]
MSFASRRSPVLSMKSMVCTSQPLASMAGHQILQAGGNAADAAICIAAVLSVIEPYSTGLGGDAFALFYQASHKRVLGINGSGRSGARCNLEFAQNKLGKTGEIPPQHGLSVTVPGTVQCWIDMLDKWGSKSLGEVLQPAIQLASDGFPVPERTQYYWKKDVDDGRVDVNSVFAPGPQFPGEVMYNREMAHILRLIVQEGRDGFYSGNVAKQICQAVNDRGGALDLQDLAEHRSEFCEPVKMRFQGVDVYECPPNGQGMVALMALDAFTKMGGSLLPRDSAEMINLQIECLRTSFTDAKRFVADPNFHKFDPYQLLLDDKLVEDRLERIRNGQQQGTPKQTCDTVSFQVVDGWGNSVSMVNSIYTGFGSGICPPGLGFSLQNRGCNFSLDPQSVNRLEGGKRPYHTIIPGMALENNELKLSFTGMGGFAQPQNHLQFLINLLVFGDNVQQAIDRPRFCLMGDGRVALEEGIPEPIANQLQQTFGQQVYFVRGYDRSVVGRGQIIARDLKTGVLSGGSDGRADGCAVPGM